MFKLSKSKNINLVKIYNKAEKLLDVVPAIKRKRRQRKIFRILKFFSFAVAGVFLLFLIFFGIYFSNFLQIYKNSLAGKSNLEQTVYCLQKSDFQKALQFSKQAQIDFQKAYNEGHEVEEGILVSRLSFLRNQFQDITYLLKTAEILSKTAKQISNIGLEADNILSGKIGQEFSEFKKEEKRKILKLIYESGPELNGIKANLDLAFLNLEKSKCRGILFPLKEKINEFKKYVGEGIVFLEKTVPATEILPALAGYPEKSSFLVMLQNSDELRPSGGFLGTYGILEIEYGDIERFDTHDIYHMDMPIEDMLKIEPPEPIKKYLVDKWYMRDANWAPDWPRAAEQIEWFFKKEDGLLPPQNKINNFEGEFNGVIAITPEFVTDIFGLIGPVVVENQEYNKNNFTRLLEYRVEKGYIDLGVSSWQRKEVIGDILKQIKIKIFDLPTEHWFDIMSLFDENIQKKNVLVFLKDKKLQNTILELGWGGELKDVTSDFFMLVDANMGALKTDMVISRSINYELKQSANDLFAKLQINYAHSGNFDWRTSRYRTYTRVFVPLGSKLLGVRGIASDKIDVGDEFNKTYFGAFISVEPGDIGQLFFEYKLPGNLAEKYQDGEYELFIQKQPGSKVEILNVDLKFNNKVKSYYPTGFYANVEGKNIKWSTDLNIDKKFIVKF